MNYSIPNTTEEIVALKNSPVNEDLIATAIAGVVTIARSQGQSLEELTLEVMAEDDLLDPVQRVWLKNLVTQAWKSL